MMESVVDKLQIAPVNPGACAEMGCRRLVLARPDDHPLQPLVEGVRLQQPAWGS